MTVLEIITQSLYLLGAYSPGQSIPAYISSNFMTQLNMMFDEWAAQRLAIFQIKRNLYPLVANQGGTTNPYTLGVGGNFNQVRPAFLDRASIILNNNPSQPLELAIQVLNPQEWQRIPVKNVYSTLPQSIYLETAYPLMNVYFWPIPQVSYLYVALYVPTAITQVTALTEDIVLPPGYQAAIIYNLALRIAPMVARPIEAWLVQEAAAKLANAKRVNISMEELTLDRMMVMPRRPYNWLTDSGG